MAEAINPALSSRSNTAEAGNDTVIVLRPPADKPRKSSTDVDEDDFNNFRKETIKPFMGIDLESSEEESDEEFQRSSERKSIQKSDSLVLDADPEIKSETDKQKQKESFKSEQKQDLTQKNAKKENTFESEAEKCSSLNEKKKKIPPPEILTASEMICKLEADSNTQDFLSFKSGVIDILKTIAQEVEDIAEKAKSSAVPPPPPIAPPGPPPPPPPPPPPMNKSVPQSVVTQIRIKKPSGPSKTVDGAKSESVDMMAQLQNTLKRRKNRASLHMVYEKLEK